MKHKVYRATTTMNNYELSKLSLPDIKKIVDMDLSDRLINLLRDDDLMSRVERYENIETDSAKFLTELIVISRKDYNVLLKLADSGAMVYDHETKQNILLSTLI